MRYSWATATDVGLVREGNEDAMYPASSGAGEGPILVAVADGLGGHVAGEIASRLAIEAATADPASADIEPADRVLGANDAVLASVASDPRLAGMGTTLTLAVLEADGVLNLAHVGDSRAYLLREGSLQQLTTDHTVIAELIAMGRLTPEAAELDPRRHLLTQSLGLGPVEVEVVRLELHENERLLLCSDGLTTMLDDERIADLLSEMDDPEEAVWTLVEAANSAGGLDNTTVAVVDISA